MKTLAKPSRKSNPAPDNALARHALEAIEQIDLESKGKKMAQVESLQAARTAIQRRIDELTHQLGQIDSAIALIKGVPTQKRERRARRNLDDARERIERWMQGHRGRKFAAGELIREFPELDGTVMSVFLKPLVLQRYE